MSIHFHKLSIKEIRKETPECVSIAFDIPESLTETFQFTHGQNITLKSIIDGEEIRRSYSICSSPLDNELRVAVKKVEAGKFSTHANNQLKEGDIIEVLPPTGKFNTSLDNKQAKNYIAFVAGSGITPVLSIIKTTLQTEPNSSFTLIYGNRNRSAIIFKEELEGLKNKYIDRFRIYHILSREKTDSEINYGRIDKEKCDALTKLIDIKNGDEFFLCGPEAMIFTVKDFLESNGIDKKNIHFELFTTGTEKKTMLHRDESLNANVIAEKKCNVTVKQDGVSFNFELPYNSQSILEAALEQGADVPYSCKGGMCCTCKAKLLEGEVEMDVNYTLEQDEIDAGFILTCQSHPRTEKVVVDYDVK